MTKLSQIVIAAALICTMPFTADAQSVSINTDGSTANASALLDVKSTTRGVLVPRMSKTERNTIAAPAMGLMVFQNAPDSVGFYYYNGTSWLWLATASGSTGWATTGNAGTTTADNFIGTTDNVALSFRQNNTWMGRWNNSNSTYFIGDSAGVYNTGSSNFGLGAKALFANTSSYANVAIGNYALSSNTTGVRNTAIGDSALYTQSYSNGGSNYLSDNTAVGNKAMFFNQPTTNGNGIKNVAMGNEAMYENTTGSQNTAIGVSALRENTTGNGNTAVGRSAHRQSGTGSANSYFGFASGFTDSTGSENTGIGTFAMQYHERGDRNTAVGYYAMSADSSGNYNTNIGAYTSFVTDTANLVTALGYAALYYNNRDYNTAVGAYAGFQNSRSASLGTQGIENTLVGYAALTGNATGSQNVAVGYKAMSIFEPNSSVTSTSPSRNVAIGDSAMQANRGNDNVAVGYRALSNTNNVNMDGHVAIGSRALRNSTATFPNTAVGYLSMDSATTATGNTGLGSYTLTAMKTGVNNTAIGNAAMYEAVGTANNLQQNTAVGRDALRVGRYYGNTAIGSLALRSDTSGIYNSALGYEALLDNLSGESNVAVGHQSLTNNTIGDFNTAVGKNALLSNTTGTNNVALGYNANVGSANLTNATAIGTNAYVQQSNSLILGSISGTNSATAHTLVGIGTTTPTARLDVDANFKLGANGVVLNEIIKTSVVYDINSLTVGAVDIQTFAVANAVAGSSVFISPNGALPNGITISYARVSTTGTVEVKFINAGTATQDPASNTFYITVIR